MATKFDYNNDETFNYSSTNYAYIAQEFTASQTYTTYSVKARMARFSGAVTGNIEVAICPLSGGNPDYSNPLTDWVVKDVTTFPIYTSDFSTPEFVFSSPVELTSSTKYAIVYKRSYSGGAVVQKYNIGNPYAGGTYKYFLASWTELAANDLWFEVWGVTGPSQATTPSPSDTATDQDIDLAQLSWVDPDGDNTFNVYFGTESGNLTLVSSEQAATTYSLSGTELSYGVTYYWRIDSYDGVDTTTGVEWSFTVKSNPFPTVPGLFKTNRLVAVAQDEVWYESMAGTLTQVTGATVDTSDQLMMFELFQKAFVVNGSILGVVDFVNTKLTCSALTTAPLPGDILTQATSNATMVVDFVNAAKTAVYGYTTSGTFNTANNVTSNDAGGSTMNPASFVPSAVAEATTMPHWYTWTKQPALTVALPTKAYLGCRYNGRAVLAGDPNHPHQWYMSRQGDPFDFDYTDITDAQSPVSGQDVDAGVIGDIIRSLMPYHDDYLVFGCANSLYWLQGDPMSGGSMATITESTGVFGAQSWCWGEGGVLYFWGNNGVYSWTPGQRPINISRHSLPKLVKDEGVNPSTHRITFGWDRKRQGINVAITLLADGSNSNYFFTVTDTDGGKRFAFFPETYPEECGVYSMHHYEAADPANSGLLFGCTDGYVRTFDDNAKDDDVGAADEVISSKVVIGPIPLANDPDTIGTLSAPNLELAGGGSSGSLADSDNATLELYRSMSASQLIENIDAGAAPSFAATVIGPGGRYSRTLQAQIGGQYAAILIKNNTAAQSWAMERLTAHIPSYRRRQ